MFSTPFMTHAEIQQYLYEHIPLSKAMAVSVTDVSDAGVILSAPLAPNINHRETVFGGSASAVAILAAWTLLYVRLMQMDLSSRVVIQRNEMKYDLPITGDFTAHAEVPDSEVWDKFIHILKRKHRARIGLSVSLYCTNKKVGVLHGVFVALD